MTSYFEIQECPNRKQKKKTFMWQWRNSKGKARLKENGRRMKRQVQALVGCLATYLDDIMKRVRVNIPE